VAQAERKKSAKRLPCRFWELAYLRTTNAAAVRRFFSEHHPVPPSGVHGILSQTTITFSPYWYIRVDPTLPYQALVILRERQAFDRLFALGTLGVLATHTQSAT